MRGLNLIDKFIFFLNSIAATLLLFSYVLPFFPPKHFAFLSVLSLTVPLLMIVNALFALFWLLKVKKQMLLSVIVLVIGYFQLGSLFKMSSSWNKVTRSDISVMSYNVRLFNIYEWLPGKEVASNISELVEKQRPDVLSIQEYHPNMEGADFSFYKFKHIQLTGDKTQSGQAIYSQYPIVNTGSVTFPNTPNNAIFADIVKDEDTVRVYNIHLQSLRINTQVDALKRQDTEQLVKSVGNTFAMQQLQTEIFLTHKNTCPYKMIVTGDFNNTACSYVYRQIKGDLNDAFKEAGNGFGRTYDFKFFPVRIDFILTDPTMQVDAFKTFDVVYSDHFPIMAKLSLH